MTDFYKIYQDAAIAHAKVGAADEYEAATAGHLAGIDAVVAAALSARPEALPSLGYRAFLETLAGPAFSREEIREEATLMLNRLEPQEEK